MEFANGDVVRVVALENEYKSRVGTVVNASCDGIVSVQLITLSKRSVFTEDELELLECASGPFNVGDEVVFNGKIRVDATYNNGSAHISFENLGYRLFIGRSKLYLFSPAWEE